jgi:Domain of unknown function (DUF929)
MPQEQKKPTAGGNKPKPPPPPGRGNQSASAKERSKAQSRPVSTKAPSGRAGAGGAGKGGSGGKGGNTPRPGSRPAPQATPRRFSGTMIAWVSIGVVVLIVAIVVIVSQLGGSSSNTSYTPTTTAPASVINAVTNIPASVYNTVGTGPSGTVNPPIIVHGKSPLVLDGKSPSILFYGAEYCPYCAAERWALTAALSRFGTWSNLDITASSQTDVYAGTHTLSYKDASLSSPYITFHSVEQYTNIPASGGNGAYTVLQNPTKEESKVISTFNSPTYIPGAQQGQISFPFISINNVALISGASYNPGILAGLSWNDIASGLSNPSNPATQAIVGTANYISAAICASTKNAPTSVCTSSGVMAASKALKLS